MLSLVIIGHIGRDAEVKEINGQKCISFSVAHSNSWTNAKGEKMQSTTWVNCDLWAQKDALSQYLKKGTLVYVEGMPKVYAYQNQQRQIVGSLQMRVDKVQLLGAKKQDDGNVSKQEAEHLSTAAGSEVPTFTDVKDDLPF